MLTERDAQAAIARQVKSLRQGRKWSLDELASRSGVSKGMLVQIEGARTNPSIGTLCRVAESFGVSVGRLIESEPEPVVKIVGADEPAVLWRGPGGGSGRLLRGVNDPAFVEVWEWRMAPGEEHDSGDHAPRTREIIHVREGSLTMVIDGADYRVRTGETIDFFADRPHRYGNPGPVEAVLTMVVVLPTGERDRRV
ncbi:helix-turn-helix domain-containing protein [Dactylosporangium matsuzakiense]|uniref:helix-turn-helix domain-containing protein n=1 Tax=Dactylosporangium matsuzakiense TaxID=53360 RepID=UPI0021C43C7D|nr:XRE family transcriptional regulator [Dactylosporangium matsuzakiense]UWZ43978.1 helix-turn-helix transcriptional regulator [Dactylosporangium matsuzakiense]